MFAVHGFWRGGGLCVWAEDSELPTFTRSRAKIRVHPFAAVGLASILAEPAGAAGEAAVKATETELVLELPGGARGPGSSPELGRPGVRDRLGTWRIPALELDADAALTFLEQVEPCDELLLGTSLRYFRLVAADANDLVRRGQVLPTLITEDGMHTARWRPVLAGAEARRFRELAAAMPPICRADGSRSPHVLVQALAALTDAAVRRSLPGPLVPPRGGGAVPFTEGWLQALSGADARVPASSRPDQVEALAAALQDWFSAAHQAEGEYRVSLRLCEPEGDGPWRISFAVQATEDPSLLLEAADVWAGRSLPGLSVAAEEAMIVGLARATRIFPELNEALRRSQPTGLDLDIAGAHAFLSTTAPVLRAAGFGVLLPDWAGRSALGLKLTTRSTTPSHGAAAASGFGLTDLVRFRWDLAVGDQTIDAAELTALAELKVPLVRMRGQWVELDERQLAAALKFLSARDAEGEMTAAEVVREVIHSGTDELPLVDVDADGRLGDLLSGEADRRLRPLATPEEFRGTLRPYQERGLAWLDFLGGLGLGAILADDMGLGKTPQTLAMLLARPKIRPTLLVCPMSLIGNWRRETARFTPGLRVLVHHGGDRQRAEDDFAAARLSRRSDAGTEWISAATITPCRYDMNMVSLSHAVRHTTP